LSAQPQNTPIMPTQNFHSAKAIVSVPRFGAGCLIVNADDWGHDRITTDRIHECMRKGIVTSASAMVFMEDSGRAAALALGDGLYTGLHLNLTEPFSAAHCPVALVEHQQKIRKHLLNHRLAQVLFNPLLTRSFEYVVAAQLEEYQRLYGSGPDKVDGHHHMHLCGNMLVQQLLPAGTISRRSFYFAPGEKGLANRTYRSIVDRRIASRHRIFDYLFSIAPLEPQSRLDRIYRLAETAIVELETHPSRLEELKYLTGGKFLEDAKQLTIASPAAINWDRSAGGSR
jgi:chitin disaccharide deacetylase